MIKIEINKNNLEFQKIKKLKQLFIHKYSDTNNENIFGKNFFLKKDKSLENKTSKYLDNKFSYNQLEQKNNKNIIIIKNEKR